MEVIAKLDRQAIRPYVEVSGRKVRQVRIARMSNSIRVILFKPPIAANSYPRTMSFTIRPIEEKDKAEWLELWRGKDSYLEFYKSLDVVPPEATETTFKRFLDPSEPVYACVAVDDSGKLIGFAHYLTHRNTWTVENSLYLNDLFVLSASRLKGVGRSLIEYVYDEADKLKCPNVYWCTQFENHRAQLLYTKVGVKAGFLTYRRP